MPAAARLRPAFAAQDFRNAGFLGRREDRRLPVRGAAAAPRMTIMTTMPMSRTAGGSPKAPPCARTAAAGAARTRHSGRRGNRAPARSLSPALMRSRTRTRKSCASGASESSIDSFWHTMQRNSLDSARARASSAGSGQHLVGLHGPQRRRQQMKRDQERKRCVATYLMAFTPPVCRLHRRSGLRPCRPRRADAQPPIGQRQSRRRRT